MTEFLLLYLTFTFVKGRGGGSVLLKISAVQAGIGEEQTLNEEMLNLKQSYKMQCRTDISAAALYYRCIWMSSFSPLPRRIDYLGSRHASEWRRTRRVQSIGNGATDIDRHPGAPEGRDGAFFSNRGREGGVWPKKSLHDVPASCLAPIVNGGAQ